MSTQISSKPVVAQPATAVTDSGKIKVGGAALSLIKPVIANSGKIRIGGAALSLIKAARK
jgi:hypothetical protein